VLDANIWVSYFISNQENIISEIIVKNKISVLYCGELITEISRVLNYPHLAKRNVNIKEAIGFIRSTSVYCTLQYPIKNYIPEDQDDNYIIALALQSNAGFVTSGDKHIIYK
jgi:putative PIN family toxin of toxin-antitoxin system